MAIEVSAIHVYPVKSCRATPLHEARVSSTGLDGDRRYQVVDDAGRPITQRTHPALATVQPTLTEQGVRLDAPGRGSLAVVHPAVNDVSARSLLGVAVEAGDAGDEAAAWFGDLLETTCRLVAMTERSEHRVPLPGLDLTTSWADAAQVLVANSTSADWLVARSSEAFGIDRFRANVTVSAGAPWVEDTWRRFRIGEAELGLGLAWPRCTIPQVDQRSGDRHREPAKVLRDHRWCASAPTLPTALRGLVEGSALFGVACSIGPVGATIRVGDAVEVIETGDPLIAAPG